VLPIAGSGGQYKADIDMTPIPYFPGREPLFPLSLFSTVRAEVDEENFVHPLASGAEAYYRYRTGGAMTIVLPDRSRITVRELEITARRAAWKLFVGSFWFDDATGQLVRAAYRLSEPLDVWKVAAEEDGDDDDVPAAVKAMFSPARFDITGITTEYELKEGRFWLPRANYAEGTMQIGFVRSPFKVQEKFSYQSVNGVDSLPAEARLARYDTTRGKRGDWMRDHDDSASVAVRDSLRREAEREDEGGSVSITLGGGTPDSAAVRRRIEADTTERGRRRRERAAERERQCAASGTYTRIVSRYEGALRYPVAIPCDSARLMASADLPKSIYDEGEEAFDERQRDELLKALDLGLQPGWQGAPVEPYWGLNLVRYNRVEGLSSAVGARWAPGGGWTANGQVRLGIADLQPNAELAVARSNARTTLGLGVYRRLSAANDRGDPLSFGAGLSSFLFGRDEGLYYRTAGVELTGHRGRFGQLGWRLFAEDQRPARKETDFSLAKVFNGNDLLWNIDAERGFATGGAATLAFTRGQDPRSWRLGGDWRAEGAFGDFDYARTALDATLSRGLGRRVEAALTGAGGWSGGDLPPQRQWYLGGAQTVRGQVAGTQSGDAFWLGRLEVARSWPIMRPVVFGDVGWAGDRARMFDRPGQVMSGAGMGASFLDGLMRVDLSRGIRPVEMWRLDLYLEARF
jgi:Haemolysin secretion/activation protein ShlB/FhaC/HecB